MSTRRTVVMVVMVVMLGVLGTGMYLWLGGSRDQAEEFVAWYVSRPVSTVDGLTLPGARVTVVEFVDVRCAACQDSRATLDRVLPAVTAGDPDAVRVLVRDYPIEPSCNRALAERVRENERTEAAPGSRQPRPKWQPHSGSCAGAVAVRLADERGKAGDMRRWLFSQTGALDQETVERAARQVGGVTDFAARFDGVLEQVKADTELAARAGVSSAPTMFINGRRIEGVLKDEFLRAALEYELRR